MKGLRCAVLVMQRTVGDGVNKRRQPQRLRLSNLDGFTLDSLRASGLSGYRNFAAENMRRPAFVQNH